MSEKTKEESISRKKEKALLEKIVNGVGLKNRSEVTGGVEEEEGRPARGCSRKRGWGARRIGRQTEKKIGRLKGGKANGDLQKTALGRCKLPGKAYQKGKHRVKSG